MPSSTEALVRAASLDPHAREQLLIRQLPRLQAWLRLRMGPKLRAREEPEDLVQSVAREALAELGDFEWRGEAAFRHWLYTRARHKLQDRIKFVQAQRRDPAREVAPNDSDESLLACYGTLCTPSRDLAAREAMQRIEAAFDELPDDYQEAITLHRLCGLDYAEIAARLQRSEGAVRNLVYRGLSRLALRLGGRHGDGAPRPD
ncbi:MAG: sigma-70 family RNA polymerase sigma factor [Planctomycetes bacterium]|jgi:RNA polymerase sigma-70 factor (ECF subfamily)|nr:sigma-70 family RNA polymerase sigma factor [Planctomycetota bacterium]